MKEKREIKCTQITGNRGNEEEGIDMTAACRITIEEYIETFSGSSSVPLIPLVLRFRRLNRSQT